MGQPLGTGVNADASHAANVRPLSARPALA
jgi:hypothetical protein